MNALVLFTIFVSSISARPQQQQIEPAYLRDYYAQIAQQNAARGQVSDVTPIFEQNTSFQPSAQIATVGQQIRVRDPGQDQVHYKNRIQTIINHHFFCFVFVSFHPHSIFHPQSFSLEQFHRNDDIAFNLFSLYIIDSSSAATIHSANCTAIQSTTG